jgi:hypothetical protein
MYRPQARTLELPSAARLARVTPRSVIRDWARASERAEPEEQWVVLCFLAGRGIGLDQSELNAALRRSELLLATGGDPRRRLELYGRAVTALAEDLDEPTLRAQLATGLDGLVPDVEGLRGATEALRLLRRDADLAWQCFATALLADALAGEDD